MNTPPFCGHESLQVKIITLVFACKQSHSELGPAVNFFKCYSGEFLEKKKNERKEKKTQHRNLKLKCICFQVLSQVTNI